MVDDDDDDARNFIFNCFKEVLFFFSIFLKVEKFGKKANIYTRISIRKIEKYSVRNCFHIYFEYASTKDKQISRKLEKNFMLLCLPINKAR
jgi:hypothetical protein